MHHHLLKVGLPGLEPGPEETGRNVVFWLCVFLPKKTPDASGAGLGAESPAPALSDDVTEAAGLRALLRARTVCCRDSSRSLPPDPIPAVSVLSFLTRPQANLARETVELKPMGWLSVWICS